MADLTLTQFMFAVVVGTLGAIVYSLHILFALDRKIARMEEHIELMAKRILREETKIEKKLKH